MGCNFWGTFEWRGSCHFSTISGKGHRSVPLTVAPEASGASGKPTCAYHQIKLNCVELPPKAWFIVLYWPSIGQKVENILVWRKKSVLGSEFALATNCLRGLRAVYLILVILYPHIYNKDGKSYATGFFLKINCDNLCEILLHYMMKD